MEKTLWHLKCSCIQLLEKFCNNENIFHTFALTGIMKRICSILLIFVTLTSTFHFAVATHYCGGKMADVGFGFGLASASCGMEDGRTPCAEEETFGKNCCHNKVQSFGGTDYFLLSPVKSVYSQNIHSYFLATINLPQILFITKILKTSYWFHSPPANFLSSLPFLRVFRI